MKTITIGTRGSPLAMWQAEWVATKIRELHESAHVVIEKIAAPADDVPDVPISRLGTKGLFTKTLEDALLAERIDVAVHSLKDMASTLPDGLSLAAIPFREDPRDVLITPHEASIQALPQRSRIGTGSPRRRAQLRRLRPDFEVLDIRGNVDTRLRKLAAGQYDALILAAAGLHRLGHREQITAYLDPSIMLPAGCQGALGIETRSDNQWINTILQPLADVESTACCTAERRLQQVLDGGCQAPLAVLTTTPDGERLSLDALVASDDGQIILRDQLTGTINDPDRLGEELATRLLNMGAGELLSHT